MDRGAQVRLPAPLHPMYTRVFLLALPFFIRAERDGMRRSRDPRERAGSAGKICDRDLKTESMGK